MNKIKAFLRNLFTGDNNQDFSFVRIFGAIGFLLIMFMIAVGVPLWTLIAIQKGVKDIPSLGDWAGYYGGAAALVVAAYGGLAGLLWSNERPKPGTDDNTTSE